MTERLSALTRTLRKYLIIGIAICLISWITTLAFYLTDIVSASPIYFIWQFVYYGAPGLCGVLVAVWIVAKIWMSVPLTTDNPSPAAADAPSPADVRSASAAPSDTDVPATHDQPANA